MNQEGIKVLLLGESAMGASLLLRRLEQRGCRCWFAVSPEEGIDLFNQHVFHLILNTGPVGRANSMIALLGEANCSVYCAYPVEDSCLWLPLMDHGRKCLGAPALRPSEFLVVLDDLITEIESEQLVALQSAPAALPRRIAIRAPAKSKTAGA